MSVIRGFVDCDVDSEISIVSEMRSHSRFKYQAIVAANNTGYAAMNAGERERERER